MNEGPPMVKEWALIVEDGAPWVKMGPQRGENKVPMGKDGAPMTTY